MRNDFQPPKSVALGLLINRGHVSFLRIVLKNSRKFLGQLMRLTRDDVRDHSISSKIDHWLSQWR